MRGVMITAAGKQVRARGPVRLVMGKPDVAIDAGGLPEGLFVVADATATIAGWKAGSDVVTVASPDHGRTWDPPVVVGATDGLYLRAAGIPTYGVQGIFYDRDDIRFHGRDERVKVESFYEGQTFLYELVKTLAQPN